MSQKRKKKGGGEGVFLHWCAMHSGKIAHTHFQTLSKPQEHTERPHVCLTLIILLQKKKGGGIISKGTNQLLPCLQQPTNLCLSNKSESSSSVQKTSGAATLKVVRVAAGLTAQSCFFGALLAMPLPPASSLFSPTAPSIPGTVTGFC